MDDFPKPPNDFLDGFISAPPLFWLLHLLVIAALVYSFNAAVFSRNRPSERIVVGPMVLSAIAVYFRLNYAYPYFEHNDFRGFEGIIAPSRTLLIVSAVGTSVSVLLPRFVAVFRSRNNADQRFS